MAGAQQAAENYAHLMRIKNSRWVISVRQPPGMEPIIMEVVKVNYVDRWPRVLLRGPDAQADWYDPVDFRPCSPLEALAVQAEDH